MTRFAEPNGLACCSRTTWSSPTPRTTCCAACGSPTARSAPRSTSPLELRTPARSPAPSRPCSRRGTSCGGRPSASSSSRPPGCTCCSRSIRAPDASEILAGTTVEGLRDGPARTAGWHSRPGSRSTATGCGSSTPRRRRCAICRSTARLHTAVGEGLFDFGHVDGPAATARLQHPLGVTVLADGSSRCSTPTTVPCGATTRDRRVSTLAARPAEPSGAVLVDGDLVVVESAAHRLVRPVPRRELVTGAALHTARPTTAWHPERCGSTCASYPRPGRKLDERYGPSTRLTVTASPPGLLAPARATRPSCRASSSSPTGEGVLQVVAQAASCDDGGEHPACYLARQDWGVPVRITRGGRRPRRAGAAGLSERTHRVKMRWSFAGPMTSHSTRRRCGSDRPDQAAVEIGVARMVDELARPPRMERTAVGEANLPAVAHRHDVQLAGHLVASRRPTAARRSRASARSTRPGSAGASR